jgi:hypothetical protein
MDAGSTRAQAALLEPIQLADSPKDVAQAHTAAVRTQDQYGVNYLKYWADEQAGKVFCLVEDGS